MFLCESRKVDRQEHILHEFCLASAPLLDFEQAIEQELFVKIRCTLRTDRTE